MKQIELRAIIIDDEPDGIKSLKLLIERYIPELNVIAESTMPEEGLRYIENYRPDIVFLDVNMPVLNGIELVKQLKFRKFELVFTTAHKEYALAALKLGTTDYLLKPIDPDDLRQAVERVRSRLKAEQQNAVIVPEIEEILVSYKKKEDKILLSDKDVIEYCSPEEIIRLEARSNYTLVVFKERNTMLVSKTLKDFEKQLCKDGSTFIRVHQSHIINLTHCLRYKREDGGIIEMSDGERVSISPTKKEEFLRRINII